MLIFFLSYLGGVLTILSPCVLPVLPFIFMRADQSFFRSGLPVLLGMAVTFTVLASFAVAGGAWLVEITQYGRYLALLLLTLLGAALIFPALSAWLMQPFVALGGRIQQRAEKNTSVGSSLLLGVAVGFLWAPCAGPILGLVLAGAALQGVNFYSALLLLFFAAGAVTSLGLALFAGGRVLRLMKRSLGGEEWLRRSLGVLVVVCAVAIALGWDVRLLSKFSFLSTAGIEQKILDQYAPPYVMEPQADKPMAPSLRGATNWLNSAPLDNEMLRGKVVLVDFWTYSCINCLRTLPYLKAWDEKYRAHGLVVLGVHAPEFAFERDLQNVNKALNELDIHYPVALDNQYTIWNAFKNRYWPAHYLIDAQGRVRHQHFGEGAYEETELMIQALLQEAGRSVSFGKEIASVATAGVAVAAAEGKKSPETYLGYSRQENWSSVQRVERDDLASYTLPNKLKVDHWALHGDWIVSPQAIESKALNDKIVYRFQGRDLHLVLGSRDGKAVRFKVLLDGAAPGPDHGLDIDAQGNGVIKGERLYQLVRQNGGLKIRTFQIEFLDEGAQAFAFTFG